MIKVKMEVTCTGSSFRIGHVYPDGDTKLHSSYGFVTEKVVLMLQQVEAFIFALHQERVYLFATVDAMDDSSLCIRIHLNSVIGEHIGSGSVSFLK